MKGIYTVNKGISHIQNLVYLGFTKLEALVYVALVNTSPLTVNDLSQKLTVTPSSLHRTLKTLKSKGMVISYGNRKLHLSAVDPSIALSKYIEESSLKKIELSKLITSDLRKLRSKEELRVEFLESKQSAFDHGIKIINNAKKNVVIFSVGEPIPTELFLGFVNAIKQGVKVKMIAQTYNKGNKELLSNWKKNGYKVRYLNAPELDFTLVVYDMKIAELHIRTPDNPDNRVGIVIHNSSYAKAQYQYFEELWEKAKEI